jgi:hypothetical protein
MNPPIIIKSNPMPRLIIHPSELTAMLPMVRMPSKNHRHVLKIELYL